jgi:2-iminobutanoate/2-iminopropanoate deaminase
MEKKAINVEFLLKAGPYSHVIEAGGFLFLTGIDPIDLEKGLIVTDDIVRATEIVMENMKRTLEAAGSSMEKVVKVTVFMRDMADFNKLNEVYAKYFPVDPPARTCVAVKEVPGKFPLKVECTALK